MMAFNRWTCISGGFIRDVVSLIVEGLESFESILQMFETAIQSSEILA